MVVFLLVALFSVALILTLVGSFLSPRSSRRTQRDVAYAPHARRSGSQQYRASNVRREPAGQPYRQSRQSYTPVERRGGRRRQVPSLEVSTYGLRSSTVRASVNDAAGLWDAGLLHWLKLMLLSGAIFGLCLFTFIQMVNFNLPPAIAIINNFVSQPANTGNSNVFDASKALVRIAQSDPNQYSSQDEHDQWANSACSATAMTEIINAYGHNYRITDILKVEAGLHEITPELGLLEAKGIDRTMDHFGFKMVQSGHTTLDDAIAVANQGHPLIIDFTNSGYWPGGHILVLRGGDAQNVQLADSSRLNKTVISRNQFLQWWNGFTALAVPQ